MGEPLRIAIFTGSFPVVSETFIVRQIVGLLELGHEVDIFADSPADAETPIHPEVVKHRLLERTTFMEMAAETAPWELPVWPVTGRTWPPGSATSIPNARRVLQALPKFFRCLATAPRLTLQVLRPSEYRYQARSLSALHRLAALRSAPGRYDVLHAHFGPVGNSFRFARTLWKAPLMVSFHGYDFSTVPRKEGADIYRQLFETADAFTVNSEYTRQQVERLGCPPRKIHKLPVGLDPDAFPFRARTLQRGEPIRLLTVARLTEIKGHEYILRAVAALAPKHAALRYDVVGDGPWRGRLKEIVRELHLEPLVIFHGACDGARVKQRMAEAHIFVLGSVSVNGDQEGQGLVLQEAQAAGLPVVATVHGALPEGLLADQSGFLVPERDVAALAERLNYLIEHSEIWPMMGEKGRAFVEAHYDIRKLNLQLAELYRQIIEEYGRAV